MVPVRIFVVPVVRKVGEDGVIVAKLDTNLKKRSTLFSGLPLLRLVGDVLAVGVEDAEGVVRFERLRLGSRTRVSGLHAARRRKFNRHLSAADEDESEGGEVLRG